MMLPKLFAPPAVAPRRLTGPDASAATALRAYEAVTDALELFADKGSLKAVLGYLGGRRRALAAAQGLAYASLYGVFRDAQLDPAHRTLETHFGPGYAPFENVVRAYGYLYAKKRNLAAMPQGGILVGTVQIKLGAQAFELTRYRCDFTGTLPRNRRWLHTHWREVEPILVHAGELFEMALAPVDERTALLHVADLHWWLSHAMPFAQGSMQIAEWLVAYIFRMRGHGGVRFDQDPASLALVAASPAQHREAFAANLQFIPTRAQPLPTPAIKTFVRDARLGDVRGIRRSINGIDVNETEPTGQTALHVAAREGHSGVVAMLLRYGANVHASLQDSGQTPLHLAAREGQLKAAKKLLKCGAALNAVDVTGQTPLHVALAAQHDGVAKLLLSFAPPLGARNALGELPLHVAACAASPKVLARLLQAYARRRADCLLDAVTLSGETALSLAALGGRADAVRVLLEHKAPPPMTYLGDDTLHPVLAELSMAIVEAGADLHLFGLLVRCQARALRASAQLLRAALLAGVPKAERRALAMHIDASTAPKR